MRNYLVLREFLKDNKRNYLNPELKIYEQIEILNINIENYYKSHLLIGKIQDERQEELTIFLIFYSTISLKATCELISIY